MRLSTMVVVTWNWLVRVSGVASRRRSKVLSVQFTRPSGAFLRTILRRLRSSSPALARALAFSMTCSGAWTSTKPRVSKPARPARPAIWWNSRAVRWRSFAPSNFTREVITTLRMGTLIPTPRVSVPQMTASRPWRARRSMSLR